MNAKLILATGSHAGLEEPLKVGYYMIGRHKECQIRPKSRSVSRRHCLLRCTPGGVKVFDLGSANGTIVNDTKLEPNQWERLCSGDQLRCGKVVFRVSVDASDRRDASPSHRSRRSTSLGKGDAWQDFDLAAFLEAEDEAERQQMYGEFRHAEASFDEQSSALGESSMATDINLEARDGNVKKVLDDARMRKGQRVDGGGAGSDLSPRARRIAKIRARIEAQRSNLERQYEIESQLSRMLRRK